MQVKEDVKLSEDLVKLLQGENLPQGVDLQQYMKEIDTQLRAAEEDAVFDCK
jgi:hypothetical protein